VSWTPTDHDIARWRLRTQALVAPHATSADAVVDMLLAVQAENPAQSAWAVACRTSSPDAADLAKLLDDGQVVRTHVLRPTWHYVRAEDIGWLLELTAPRVRRTTGQGLRAEGLDDAALDVLTAAVLEILAVSPGLTRDDVAAALASAGHQLGGHALMMLLADLELQQLVVSGPPREGVHTYARFDDRVRETRRLERDEALAELVRRYLTGHGPATVADLSYWGTLAVGDVRRGLAEVQHELASFEHDGRTYWHAPDQEPSVPGPADPPAHLLQILDEIYRGYQDSRMVLDIAGVVPRGREATAGMALVDAQMVATMKRTVTPRQVRFDLRPYDGRRLAAGELVALEDAAARYGSFLGLDAEIVLLR
jgi:hypothetical protein